jgi:pantothenate synthetase
MLPCHVVCFIEHFQVLDAQNLQPVHEVTKESTLVAIAAHFPAKDQGMVRLIDNCII